MSDYDEEANRVQEDMMMKQDNDLKLLDEELEKSIP